MRTSAAEAIDCYRVRAGPYRAEIITLGGTITRLEVPDRAGRLDNVVLGYRQIPEYAHGQHYFGATVGRVANRVANGRFSLQDQVVQLSRNHGSHHLHGGVAGFDRKVWTVQEASAGDDAMLSLQLHSAAGDEGYPGNLTASLLYTLHPSGELRMEFAATTDAPTVVNMTNHSYFNLRGECSGDILAHELSVKAERFCVVDAELIPTGELRSVAGTPFDFRRPASIGDRIAHPHPQLLHGRGYDHCMVLEQGATRVRGLRRICTLSDPATGRQLEISTDQPGLQVYSGNFLDGSVVGTGGKAYERHAGLCLETQAFPDAPNHPEFPSVTLMPGERYSASTAWHFSVFG